MFLGQIPEIQLALANPVVTDADGRFQTPEILDADVLKQDIAYQVAVSCVETHTALIIELWFTLIEDVDIDKFDVFERIGIG